MADKRPAKRGGRYCMAGGPNKTSCTNTSYTEGVSMHYFPSAEDARQKWTKFVRRHRKNFTPSKSSSLCSVHFEDSCFEQRPAVYSEDRVESIRFKRFLIKGSIPTRDTVVPYPSPESSRKRRKILRDSLKESYTAATATTSRSSGTATCTSPAVSNVIPEETADASFVASNSPAHRPVMVHAEESTDKSLVAMEDSSNLNVEDTPALVLKRPLNLPMTSTPKPNTKCNRCSRKSKKTREWRKKHQRLNKRFQALLVKYNQLKNTQDEKDEMDENETPENKSSKEQEESDHPVCDAAESDEDEMSGESESELPEEPDWAALEENAFSAGSSNESEEDDCQKDDSGNYIRVAPGTVPHEEPKFIVFFSMLMNLFTIFCFKCKQGKPSVIMKSSGTMVTVYQHCFKCGENTYHWCSQPLVLGKYPAGNILLSFGVLMAGASISKVLLVFRHMGLSAYNIRTFFTHQRTFLFPAILHYWETCRAALLNTIKGMKDVIWCGDGRFDSMGHSAKYGAYTMFCSTILKVVHFEILQANETGGSSPMELEGAKRAFSYLKSVGTSVTVFISDRHRGIAKWIRESQVHTAHFFDIWHIARSITKAMLKLSKESGCGKIKDWMKGVRNHLYWCATSTKQGFENMILAKWRSFMRHVANKHEGHPDSLFAKCAHEVLEPRRWIKIGTQAYDKLNNLLMSTRLLGDIKKLSPDAQTSCLEGFHATLNHWHPKMVCFSWLSTYCRHILASLHFNESVHRDTKLSKEGEAYTKVTYPKFKLGEEIVREVSVPPTYNYVEDVRKLVFSMPKGDLKAVLERYSSRAPQPLNTQFPERRKKEEAVKLHAKRKKRLATELYPAAEEQDTLLANCSSSFMSNAGGQKKRRKTPACSKCGKPVKGHKRDKNVLICPPSTSQETE